MGKSLRLFSVRGIDIKLHFTFPLILILAALQFGLAAGGWGGALFGVAAISLLFVLVTLHELGHAFAAQRYHVEVKQIVLSPIGGVAQLAEIPDNPRQELVIAAAGPAVNFAFAVLAAPLVALFGIDLALPSALFAGDASFGLETLFSYVFVTNILLALFNLLPAFPLDGGRILRALLALRMDYVRATNAAAAIGRASALVLGLYGLMTGGFFLMLIALFVFTAAGQEAAYVRYRRALHGYTVQQVYSPSVVRIDPGNSIQQVANLMLAGPQADFPVVIDDQLVGLVSYPDLVEALQTMDPATPVEQIMRSDVDAVVPADELAEVSRRMDVERIGALPVVAGGRFLGLVTQAQIDMLKRLVLSSPKNAPRPQAA